MISIDMGGHILPVKNFSYHIITIKLPPILPYIPIFIPIRIPIRIPMCIPMCIPHMYSHTNTIELSCFAGGINLINYPIVN